MIPRFYYQDAGEPLFQGFFRHSKSRFRQLKCRYFAIVSRPRMMTASQKDPSPKMTSKVDNAIFLSEGKVESGTSKRHP